MANGNRDVNLTIRAKNEASKALDAVSAALATLTKSQADVSRGSAKTSGLLTQLGTELGKLNQQIGGMSTMDRLTRSMEKAAGSVARLETSIAGLNSEQEKLAGEIGKTESALGGLNAKSQQLNSTFTQQSAAAKKAQASLTALNKEVKDGESALGKSVKNSAAYETQLQKLQTKLDATKAKHRELTQEILNAENPSARLIASFERTDAALQKQAAALTKAQAAYTNNRAATADMEQSLARLRAAQTETAVAFEQAKTSQAAAAASLKQVSAAVRDAEKNLRSLQDTATDNAVALDRQDKALAASRIELAAVEQAAKEADVALDKIGQTVRQRLLRSLVDSQAELAKYQASWQQATAAVRQAVASGASMSAPTPQLTQNIAVAQASKQAYLELQAALQQMRTAVREAGTDVTKLSGAQQTFVSALDRVKAKTHEVSAAQQQLAATAATAGNAVVSTSARQAAGYQQVTSSIGKMTSANRDAGASLDALEGKGRRALSWGQRLSSEMIALTTSFVGVYAAIQQLSGVTKTFTEMEAVSSRMGVAFNGNADAIKTEMAFLQTQAARLGVDIRVLAGEYSKLAVATKGSSLEGDATRKIFISLSEAFRVNKLSSAQMELAFNAVSQMVNKGTVSMEELRQQLAEKMPGAFNLAAKSMGKTTAEFTKLVSTGQVATDDFLPKFAAELDKTFGPQLGKSLESLTTEIGQFQNEITKAQLTVANGGFIEGLRTGLKDLTKYFQSAEGQQFFSNLGAAAGGFLKVLAALPKYFDELSIVAAVFVGRKLTGYIAELSLGFTRFAATMKPVPGAVAAASGSMNAFSGVGGVYIATTATAAVNTRTLGASLVMLGTQMRTAVAGMTAAGVATRALAGTMGVLRGAMAMLGGLPGIIITGLTVAFSYWLTSADDVVETTSKHEDQMRRLIGLYQQTAGEAGKFAKEAKKAVSLDEVETNFNAQLAGLKAASEKAASYAGNIVYAFERERGKGFSEVEKQVVDLVKSMRDGQITARQYRDSLTGLLSNNDLPERLRKFILQATELNKEFVATEDRTLEAAAAMRALGLDISKLPPQLQVAVKSMDELANGNEKVTETVKDAKAAYDTLKTALDELKGKIPSLSEEMELQKTLGELDQIIEKARKAAEATKGTEGQATAEQQLRQAEQFAAQARAAAQQQYLDKAVKGGLVNRIVTAESSGDANARNSNSTATGLGQFIESTWERMFRQYFPERASSMSKDAILALRTNAELSKQMVELYAKENAAVLQNAGVAVTDAALYLSHFLGPGGAVKVLTAAPDTPLAELLGQQAIDANASVLKGKTAGQLTGWAQQKVGTSDTELAAQQTLLQLDKERADAAIQLEERAQQYHETLAGSLELKKQESELGKQKTLQDTINLAIAKAENDAKKAGTVLSEAEKQNITEITTNLYQRKAAEDAITQAKKDQEEAEKRINLLTQLRRDILQQMQTALEAGNTEVYVKLQGDLALLDEKLKAALESQLKLAQAMSDPVAAAAAAANIQMQIDALGKLNQKAILTEFNVGKLFGDNLIAGADAFLAKIRETGDVFGSLEDAFRQFASDFLLQLAQMILKQAIMNGLLLIANILTGGAPAASGGGGMGGILSAFGVGVQHNGGVTGTGNMQRSVSPAWFTNATRYHSGGVAGLKPNEVPTILEKGEEVLPANDPRHVNNGGGQGSTEVKIVNAIDAGSFVSAGVEDIAGQKAILNFMRANSGAVRGAIGV